jgi:hypothetical protein
MFSSHNSSHNSRNNSRPASRNNSRPPSTEPEPNPAREYEEMYLYDETTETNKQGFKGILPVTKNELFKFQDTVSKNIESLQLENKEQISLVQANILYDQKTSNENSKQEILDIVNKNYLNIMEVVSKSFEDNKSNIQTLLEGLPLIITNIIESKEVSPQDKEKMTTDPIPEPIPEQHKQPGINEDDNKSFRYNLKVKQLIRDGIVTEHEAITHPAYVIETGTGREVYLHNPGIPAIIKKVLKRHGHQKQEIVKSFWTGKAYKRWLKRKDLIFSTHSS